MVRSLIIINAGSLIIVAFRHTLFLHDRIRRRYGGQKASRIRMHRIAEDLLRGTGFEQMPLLCLMRLQALHFLKRPLALVINIALRFLNFKSNYYFL